MKVYNKSKELVEEAKQETCPKCKGSGSGRLCTCPLCNGYGTLWISKNGSGWTRALYRKLEKSQLY